MDTPVCTGIHYAEVLQVFGTVCGSKSLAEVFSPLQEFVISHEKGLETRGPALWEGVRKFWHQGCWRTDLCVFITCPISLVLFLGQLICWDPSDLGYRLCILLPVTPLLTVTCFFERIPGNTNPSGISMRVACLESSTSKFCTSVSLQMHLVVCVKRQCFSGEEFVYPLSELHALKGAGWNPGPFQVMRILLISISTFS